MDKGKARRGIVRNGVLVSLMAFYFSCGKDIFPPDSPGDLGSERSATVVSLGMEDTEERQSPCAEHLMPCLPDIQGKLGNAFPDPRSQQSAQKSFHLEQLSHQNGAPRSAANRIVR